VYDASPPRAEETPRGARETNVELTQRLGFDAERRKARALQFGLGPSSQALTDRLHADVFAPNHEHLHRFFFRALHDQPSFEKVITDSTLASRVVRSQRAYLATLGHDPLSEGYFESRLKAGALHMRLGVPLADYMATSGALEREIVRLVEERFASEAASAKELVDHVISVCSLDLSLAMECYHRLTLEELEQHLRRAQSDHEQLRTVVRRDTLTGTSSRDFVLATLDHSVHEAKTMHLPLSVAMVDLDHFKRVNDMHGHLVGDAVLRIVAERMREALRDDDLVGRYGGEEFLLILRGAPLATAGLVADRLRKRIGSQPIEVDGHRLHVTTSVGVAQLGPGEDPTGLIARADAALYRAKHLGRDRVSIDALAGQR
jgi:diguanylate cyclase (GGDEF)-like protein